MGVRALSTPREAPPRARTVAGFYSVVGLVGFFWHATAQDNNDIWRSDPSQGALTLLLTPLLGVGAGLIIVQVFRALEGHMAWLPSLHAEFRAMFGRPSGSEVLLLAASSALAEELLFRGAMLERWGLAASSVVFALLHIPPKRSLWPWTVSSFAVGGVLGGLTLLTENLGAAVAAHFVINLQNLFYITRNPPRPTLPGPVRPNGGESR